MSVEGAGATGGGGGGFDTSSSDEGWCGRGGGLRDFERGSAENTRRALLRNDAQLCEPPPLLPPPSGLQQQQQQQQRQQPPLRFVPGDPFAKEEADVGAWTRHFTYLAVAPSGTVFSKNLEPRQSAEKETEVEAGAEAAVNSRSGEKSGAVAAVVSAAAGRATTPSTVATAAAAVEGEEEGDEREQTQQYGEGDGLEEEEEGQGEEGDVVYASHGVYEEYLAYDCRPPGTDENEGSQHFTAEEAAGANATAAAAAAAVTLGGQGRWPNTSQEGDGRASRPRLDTPQRELRQEIMDRLFDEVWERLTPDLMLLVELDAKSADPGAGGGDGRPRGEGKRPELGAGDGGGSGGGGVGARAPVVGSGRSGFATEFGRDDDDGFRRNSMEH